ncbi:ribosomal protein S18-alanine N-acetyltransferase [Sphingomonas jaspsi]|uniref:ribosomal protein S18-alanine N-acetyltransferase n=1 Tax=Sphingomonas jaspsi TaxID=392409 RepID=UPI0004B18D94|nr:ribosomal protein S18-alanine N-acetyltransferase [Sphingomonas jaspsi]
MVSAPDMILLRAGHVEDLDAVMAIMNRSFDPCFGEAWTRSQCSGILPMPGVTLTIAALDGAPVGFALARTVLDESELLLLAVDPDHHGRGAGKALLEHFTGHSRSLGARHIHLEVRDGNTAIRLYQQAGYELVGRRRDYYKAQDGQRYDALTMSIPSRAD